MKEEVIEKITAEIDAWQYIKKLPDDWKGFSISRKRKVYGDCYDILSYINEAIHRSVTLYYHDETHEYKLRTRVGLNEFCNYEFIADDIDGEEKLLRERLENQLIHLSEFDAARVDTLVIDKKIMEWKYAEKLPESLEGFTKFISPEKPLRYINGSYILLDYSDFAGESNFLIYYNIFRDEFFGEAKIKNIPDVNYDFDCQELDELAKKLDELMVPRLKQIKQQMKLEARI